MKSDFPYALFVEALSHTSRRTRPMSDGRRGQLFLSCSGTRSDLDSAIDEITSAIADSSIITGFRVVIIASIACCCTARRSSSTMEASTWLPTDENNRELEFTPPGWRKRKIALAGGGKHEKIGLIGDVLSAGQCGVCN